jgi:hypothetical protein
MDNIKQSIDNFIFYYINNYIHDILRNKSKYYVDNWYYFNRKIKILLYIKNEIN